MPAERSEITPIKGIVCMHEAVDVIRRVLLTPILSDSDLLSFVK